MDRDATWYGGWPRPRPHCLVWGWIKMPLDTEVDLCPRHTMLDRDPAPSKMGTTPPLSAHVYCGQTVGWINATW